MKKDYDLEVGSAWCVGKKSSMGLSDGRGQESGETSARGCCTGVRQILEGLLHSTKVFGSYSE